MIVSVTSGSFFWGLFSLAALFQAACPPLLPEPEPETLAGLWLLSEPKAIRHIAPTQKHSLLGPSGSRHRRQILFAHRSKVCGSAGQESASPAHSFAVSRLNEANDDRSASTRSVRLGRLSDFSRLQLKTPAPMLLTKLTTPKFQRLKVHRATECTRLPKLFTQNHPLPLAIPGSEPACKGGLERCNQGQ